MGVSAKGYWWLAFDYMNFRVCGNVGNHKKGGWFPLGENSRFSSLCAINARSKRHPTCSIRVNARRMSRCLPLMRKAKPFPAWQLAMGAATR